MPLLSRNYQKKIKKKPLFTTTPHRYGDYEAMAENTSRLEEITGYKLLE